MKEAIRSEHNVHNIVELLYDDLEVSECFKKSIRGHLKTALKQKSAQAWLKNLLQYTNMSVE